MQLLSRIIKEKPADEQEPVLELKFQSQTSNKDALNEEEELLDEAQLSKRKAQSIIAGAESEAQRIKAMAYQEGVQKAQSEVVNIIDNTYVKANRLLDEIESYRQNVLSELKDELCGLTMDIVKKIIKAEVSLERNVTSNIVLDAIDRVKNRKKVNIFVNPRDLQFVESVREEAMRKLNEASLEIISDPLVEIGGCRIHTETGWIDATIDNQLRELEVILKL